MIKIVNIGIWVIMLYLFCLFSGCVSVQKGISKDLFPELVKGQTAAVSYILEADSGDITALGNLWRDRIEKILAARGIQIKARKDIVSLIDDVETFSTDIKESDIWNKAGADIIVLGRYTVLKSKKSSSPDSIRVIVKAYRASDATLVSAEEFVEKLDPSWEKLASKIFGNAYQDKFETVLSTSSDSNRNKPFLTANLNRKNSCFTPGQSVKIKIKTKPGIFIYIFNLTADGNVSLLYPNQWLKNRALDFETLVFPPLNSNITELVLFPLEKGKTSRESFKIVASRSKLDFSFLPVPENHLFAGTNGKDIDRITNILEDHGDYSQVSLTYFVGNECESN